MNKPLYIIEKEYAEIAYLLQDNGGGLTDELQTALQINKDELEVKAQNYGLIIREMSLRSQMVATEIDRLKKLKESYDKSEEKLKEAISSAMTHHGIMKVESPILKLSFRKSESILIDDEQLLNSKFITTKVTHTPNKIAIKEAIKSGENVQGARLIENFNLQIK